MITCGFLSGLVIKVINVILDLIPDLNIPVFTVPETVLTVFNVCWYFLPMTTIISLFGFAFNITVFRLTVAIILRIKSFIPGMGGT